MRGNLKRSDITLPIPKGSVQNDFKTSSVYREDFLYISNNKSNDIDLYQISKDFKPSMFDLNSHLQWYQRKIGSYDQQNWEVSVEQRILYGLEYRPKKEGSLNKELIDIDLVRGSTFSKAKPRHGLNYVLVNGLKRVILFPFYYNHWKSHLSREIIFLCILHYLIQIIQLVIYSFWSDSTEIMLEELLLPLVLATCLGVLHAHIIVPSTSKRNRKRNPSSITNSPLSDVNSSSPSNVNQNVQPQQKQKHLHTVDSGHIETIHSKHLHNGSTQTCRSDSKTPDVENSSDMTVRNRRKNKTIENDELFEEKNNDIDNQSDVSCEIESTSGWPQKQRIRSAAEEDFDTERKDSSSSSDNNIYHQRIVDHGGDDGVVRSSLITKGACNGIISTELGSDGRGNADSQPGTKRVKISSTTTTWGGVTDEEALKKFISAKSKQIPDPTPLLIKYPLSTSNIGVSGTLTGSTAVSNGSGGQLHQTGINSRKDKTSIHCKEGKRCHRTSTSGVMRSRKLSSLSTTLPDLGVNESNIRKMEDKSTETTEHASIGTGIDSIIKYATNCQMNDPSRCNPENANSEDLLHNRVLSPETSLDVGVGTLSSEGHLSSASTGIDAENFTRWNQDSHLSSCDSNIVRNGCIESLCNLTTSVNTTSTIGVVSTSRYDDDAVRSTSQPHTPLNHGGSNLKTRIEVRKVSSENASPSQPRKYVVTGQPENSNSAEPLYMNGDLCSRLEKLLPEGLSQIDNQQNYMNTSSNNSIDYEQRRNIELNEDTITMSHRKREEFKALFESRAETKQYLQQKHKGQILTSSSVSSYGASYSSEDCSSCAELEDVGSTVRPQRVANGGVHKHNHHHHHHHRSRNGLHKMVQRNQLMSETEYERINSDVNSTGASTSDGDDVEENGQGIPDQSGSSCNGRRRLRGDQRNTTTTTGTENSEMDDENLNTRKQKKWDENYDNVEKIPKSGKNKSLIFEMDRVTAVANENNVIREKLSNVSRNGDENEPGMTVSNLKKKSSTVSDEVSKASLPSVSICNTGMGYAGASNVTDLSGMASGAQTSQKKQRKKSSSKKYHQEQEDPFVLWYKEAQQQGSGGVGTNNVGGVTDSVSCYVWENEELKKTNLSLLDIGWSIIQAVERYEKHQSYSRLGLLVTILLCASPLFFRCYINWDLLTTPMVTSELAKTNNSSLIFNNSVPPPVFVGPSPIPPQKHNSDIITTLVNLNWSLLTTALLGSSWPVRMGVISGLIMRLFLYILTFLLLSVADRSFQQRLQYAKNFCRLTSSRRARKYCLPHFRLNKLANIKCWLSLRSYLKKRGPQRSVDSIISSAFYMLLAILSLTCVNLLRSSSSEIFIAKLINWDLMLCSVALAIFMLRFLLLGTKITKKYRNLSIIITEQINLFLAMQSRPHKKDELMLAHNVLRLAESLLKEVEGPFRICGWSMNPLLYNILKVVILSVFSAVLSDGLGFKIKLYKIKLNPINW